MKWPFVTQRQLSEISSKYEQYIERLLAEHQFSESMSMCDFQQKVEKRLSELQDIAESAVHVYKCIICEEDFAKLPGQSPKRCSHCQTLIKEASGISQGNSGHRPSGHTTRNEHKKVANIGK